MTALLFSLALLAPVQADTLRYSGREGQLEVRPPRVESPSISVDARLDEPEWASAAILTGFTQYTPIEGAVAKEETEVRVFYSSDAIYFGFHVFDSDPENILVHLTERDQSTRVDDWVRIMLDTFDDERQAYSFFVNPYGIQTDGLWLESITAMGGPTGPKVDFNPDYIWDSHGRIVEDGWIAEFRIPYVSLRFPDAEVQNWGIQIARGITRTGFKSSWAPLTLDISSVLAQSGKLVGLTGLRPKRLVELNPVTTAKLEGARVGDVYSRGGVDPEAGLNARVGITPNLVLDATLNPDFSQIEADADQVQVNERFALFFPEKRLFFLEGAEIFRSTQALVHTRRIIDPIAGAKLTGKVGDVSVAYLGAVDKSPTSVFGGTSDAVFNLMRLRRDVGAGSSVGMLFTDRSLTDGGGYNRVLSGDARLLFGGRYALETQLTGSWTSSGVVGDPVGLKPAVTLNFVRSGLNFHYSVRFEDLDPDFRVLSGFMPRVGDTQLSTVVGMDRYGAPGALVERMGVEFRSNHFFDHEEFWDGRSADDWEFEAWPSIAFRGSRSLTMVLRWGGFRFQPDDYGAYDVEGPGGAAEPFIVPPEIDKMLGFAAIPNIRINDALKLSGRVFLREVPLFAEGGLAWERQFAPTLTVQPNEALQVEVGYTWARLWRKTDDSVYSTVKLPRLKVQYQLGRSVFARLIGQYDLEDRSALRHPVTGQPLLVNGVLQAARDRGNFQGQALLSYEPSPGKVFFLGYSRVMDGAYGYDLGAKRLLQDGFFVKLSYLFRM